MSRIDEVARDFRLLDTWDVPAEGTRDDFPRLLDIVTALDPAKAESRATRTLFALRWRIGELLHWDDDSDGFVPLSRSDDEYAAEITNATVHGILHLAWVAQPDGRYRGRLSVYVKPRGALGTVYLALISPFRHVIVYPALMRQIGRAWSNPTRRAPAADLTR